jgi:ketosteroid isomerase-like protein
MVGTVPSARELMYQYMNALSRRDADTIESILAPDVVQELPFAPPWLPTRTPGRDRFMARVRATVSALEELQFTDVSVDEVNAELAYAEFNTSGLRSGMVVANSCVLKVVTSNGLIVLWREYLDPQRVMHLTPSGEVFVDTSPEA